MGNSGNMLSGGCLCGAVRFDAKLSSRNVGVCHCRMCRRWTAGPFLALECDEVRIADAAPLGCYRSSEWAERCYCKNCGTPLFYRLIPRNLYFVSAEAFDSQDGFVLEAQGFIEGKPAYYTFANVTRVLTGAEVFAAYTEPEK